MTPLPAGPLDIRAVIARRRIETHFQPITSIRRMSVVGVEALSRGAGPFASPAALFQAAEREHMVLKLDRLCRETAFASFAPLRASNPDLLLFVNFHTLTVDNDGGNPAALRALAQSHSLEPRSVAVEILETPTEDAERLRRAVAAYKDCGFLVVMDDVGAGYSNLDRIAAIRPDILKVDRSLVSGLDRDFHKQEVFKSLVNLSERIGGWVIAEGVEEQAEAIAALDLGADMVQGFYFARPHRVEGGTVAFPEERAKDTATRFKGHVLNRINARKAQSERQQRILEEARAALCRVSAAGFEAALERLMPRCPELDSAAVLTPDGIQATRTVLNAANTQRRKSLIFHPPGIGTDHSRKEYYYLLWEAGLDPYRTNPYVPLPNENLCITITTRIQGAGGAPYILCLHMDAGENNEPV